MKMTTRNSPNLSLKNINVEYTPKKTDLNVKVQRRFLNFNVTSKKPILPITPSPAMAHTPDLHTIKKL
jgi:hypothetical protein